MTTDRWTRIGALFEAAADLPAVERAAFLRDAADGDDALVREVQALLAEDTHTHALLDGVALDHATVVLPDSLAGQTVGTYRVLRELGRGGSGTVYLAERADGVFEQRVALKVIRRGFASEDARRRFRAERQILARLDHPNIARLFDGGLTADGRPYFVMELVEGQPIDAYCDTHRLTVDERLDLFVTVCRAVLYAHRRLIVHRDLKPDNILVAEGEDGRPVVKLLDFGIAKVLVDGVEDDATAGAGERPLTREGLRVMTPEYASPEQVRGELVGTASDIYSLGVVLYELLAGHRPYALTGRSPAEVERVVCRTEPPRPSTVVERPPTDSLPGGEADRPPTAVSDARRTEPRRLRRRLTGDLDTVVLKALRKEPDRRYASAAEFADDLHRHRVGLPVSARPDTVGYRLRKFAGRHRAGVLAAAGVLALVVALVGFYTLQLQRERDRAQTEATKAQEVAALLVGLFEEADPLETLDGPPSVRAVLDAGTARLGRDLADQPTLRAELLTVVGAIYLNLGEPAEAVPLLQEATALHRAHPDDPEAQAVALRRLGRAHRRLDRADEAAAAYRAALQLHERTVGRRHAETATTLAELGALAYQRGAYADAEAHLREALAVHRAVLPDSAAELAPTLADLGILLERTGRLDEADAVLREALAVTRASHPETHPNVAVALSNLGVVARERGDPDAAEAAYREALAIARAAYGDDHLETATLMRNLASVRRDQEAYDEALDLYTQALAIRRARLGPDHPRIANLLNSVGTLHVHRGDLDRAAETYAEVLAIYRRSAQAEPALVAPALHNLASVLEGQGRLDEAEARYREALATLRAHLPPESTDLGFPLTSLGTLLNRRGAHAEAATLMREAVAVRRAGLPPDHRYTAQAERRLSDVLAAQGATAEAEALLDSSLARLRAADADAALIEQAEERLATVRATGR